MSSSLFQSSTFKVVCIGVLALLMLIPLSQVQGLIAERSLLRAGAVMSIADGWGGEQHVGGPVLAVPRTLRVQTANGWTTQETTEIILPNNLRIDAIVTPDTRSYGIYHVAVYTAELNFKGTFAARDLQTLPQQESYAWDRAELRVPVGDVHGIRRVSAFHLGGDDRAFGPGNGGVAPYGVIAVPIDASDLLKTDASFQFDMTLAGTQSLQLLPLARRTEAHIAAPWASPNFNGAFLPAVRTVSETGFDANWQVLDLNRRFGQHWQESSQDHADVGSSAFGVTLYQPVGVYQQNERAGKYGILFIALTFVAFFLFEILKKLRLHPVQYLLVGFALATFYVVLLALSEQIAFGWAYCVAGACVVGIVASYASAILGGRKAGLTIGAMMALVFGLLFGLIVSEQYSLLMGAIALLVTVAALMRLTRYVDWYAATDAVAPALAQK